jgi:hypothetical protein
VLADVGGRRRAGTGAVALATTMEDGRRGRGRLA